MELICETNQTLCRTVAPASTGLLSDYATWMFKIVNYVVLSSAISIVGLVANSINICVLVKQGFSNSMNISFFGMAISDIGSLLTLLWLNACLSPFIKNFFNDIHYLFGAWLHGCSARITGWITVYVTVERYLSIAKPLKVKKWVTPNRTVGIVVTIYILNLLTLFPEVSTVYFDWKMVTGESKIVNGVYIETDGLTVEGLVFAVHAALTMMSFVGLVIFTIVLVSKIKKKSLWRKSATSDESQHVAMSMRDRKTVVLVITVATLLIVCYIPTVTFSIVTSCVPAFSLQGKESNVFYIAWSFAFITHSINSSLIVLLYYKMSSRYRHTFNQIISGCLRFKSSPKNIDGKLEDVTKF
ncbi:tachykinin-like peptides receptor 99D [Biomphalaria glabrata]|nr:tachykinin-like peptides receptor 99D [Biomphalaria glabrata]